MSYCPSCHPVLRELREANKRLTAAQQRIAELEAERDEARRGNEETCAQLDRERYESVQTLMAAEQRGFERGVAAGYQRGFVDGRVASVTACEGVDCRGYAMREGTRAECVDAIRRIKAKPPEQPLQRSLEDEFDARYAAAPDKAKFVREWTGWSATHCHGCGESLDGGNKPWRCKCQQPLQRDRDLAETMCSETDSGTLQPVGKP